MTGCCEIWSRGGDEGPHLWRALCTCAYRKPHPHYVHWGLLRTSPRPASLTSHADRLFRPAHRVGLRPSEPRGAPDRERRASSSVGGPAATGTRAPAVATCRSAVLGVALSPVARLATRAGHRQARHGPPVASNAAFGSTGAGRVGRVGPVGLASRAPSKPSSARLDEHQTDVNSGFSANGAAVIG